MKKNILIIGAVIAVVLVGLEVFYFRFHTYFQTTEVQETLPPVPSSAPAAMQPRTLAQGSFTAVDAIHKGSGTARIVEQGGVRYLRLEDFSVTNGPDLYVYLVRSSTPGGSLESLDGYVSLGRLKGNVGNQTYDMPAGIEGYDTVVIWCEEFGVLFSYAAMGPGTSSVPEPVVCTADAFQCPDGTWVGRTGPRCEFICH